MLDFFKTGGLDGAKFFSLEQAIVLPMPIIPTWKVGGALIGDVIMLHVPLPCDNGIQDDKSAPARIDALVKRNKELDKLQKEEEPKYIKAQADYEAALKAYDDATAAAPDPSASPGERPEFEGLADEVRRTKELRDASQALIRGYQAEKDKNVKEMGAITEEWRNFRFNLDNANSATFGRAPRNEEEEKDIQTFGWSYLRLAGEIVQMAKSGFKSVSDGKFGHLLEDITSRLFYPTRLVNLAGGPIDLWPAGQDRLTSDLVTTDRPNGTNGSDNIPLNFNSLKATWSVPAGRAVRLDGISVACQAERPRVTLRQWELRLAAGRTGHRR